MANNIALNDGIQSMVAQLGTTRDKAASLEYVAIEYDDHQLEQVYRTSWLARKIVTIPALDAFREWRAWQAPVDMVEQIEAEETRLGLRQKLVRAKTLARLYGEAFIYFDLGDDPSTLVRPDRIKKNGIRFATVMSHRQMVAGDVDQDPLSETFGDPLFYRVAGGLHGDITIHPSRLMRFIGSERPDEFALYGSIRRADSVLTSLLSTVAHFDSTEANVASLIFEAKVDVISVKGLMSVIAGNPHEERKLLARYALAATAKGNNGMLLLDGDTEEYTQKTFSFTALTDIMDRQAQNASGGADIPATRLFGQAPSGMNATGDSDTRNYYDRIASEQELEIRPIMGLFDECLIRSALGSRPSEVHYTWNSLWQVSDKERSDLGTAGASMLKSIKETGLIPDEVLAKVLVNLATQDGTLPGLEGEYTAFFAEGGEWDLDQEEPPTQEPPTGGPEDGPDGEATQVVDGQARAPKGTSNGGQWVKGGGSVGGAEGALASRLETAPPPITSIDIEQAVFIRKPNSLLGTGTPANGAVKAAEAAAVAAYTGDAYIAINEAARGGKDHPLIKDLDGAVSRRWTTREMVLVRGVSSEAADAIFSAAKKGTVVTDKGFMSATRDPMLAEAFSDYADGYGLKMTVPVKTRLLPAATLSTHGREDEFILPRNTRLRVDSIDQQTRIINVTVLPPKKA